MLIDRRFCKDVADIAKISLPAQTRTYFPVGHAEFRNRVVERFEKIGRGVEDEGYYLKNDGDVMLGMMVMESRTKQEEETPLTVLVRNSYDKTHSAGIASGPSVFYCLNMCISGSDVSYLRKHTKNVWRDLNVILDEVVSTSENRYQERLDEKDKEVRQLHTNYLLREDDLHRQYRTEILNLLKHKWKGHSVANVLTSEEVV